MTNPFREKNKQLLWKLLHCIGFLVFWFIGAIRLFNEVGPHLEESAALLIPSMLSFYGIIASVYFFGAGAILIGFRKVPSMMQALRMLLTCVISPPIILPVLTFSFTSALTFFVTLLFFMSWIFQRIGWGRITGLYQDLKESFYSRFIDGFKEFVQLRTNRNDAE